MSLKLRIYYNAIFGAIGGLFSWFLLGRVSIIADYHILVRDMISGAIIGVFIGVAVSLVDGIFSRSARRMMRMGYYGALFGTIGGAIGLLVGELFLFLLSGGILGRAVGWMFIGLAVGMSEGIANRSRRKISYGGIGGALGGFIGGSVFESLRQVVSSYLFSQALGMVILGACIGSLIAIVQDVLKQAVIKVLKGRQEGKEFPVFQERALIGSAERCDIGIFGTPGVAQEHAEIRREREHFLLRDLGASPEGILVNDQRVTQEQPLKDGDQIQVGKAVLLFSRRSKGRNPVAGASALGLLLVTVISFMFTFSYPLHAQNWQTQLRQIEKVNFPEITLYVGVTDNSGDPIETLTVSDFKVRENGKLVRIKDFIGPGSGELRVALVIDKSSSMRAESKLIGAKNASGAFVRLMRAQDSCSLFAFDGKSQKIQGLTQDTNLLIQQIDSIQAGGSTACFDGIYHALESLEVETGIKAVLVLTDGGDTGSSHSLEETIKFAQKTNIPVYTVGLGSRNTTLNTDQGIYEPYLKAIANGTGGEYFYTPSADELTELYRKISNQLQFGYGLIYQSPTPIKDGTERHIAVSVSHAGSVKKTTGVYYLPGVTIPQSSVKLFIALLVPLLLLLFLPLVFGFLRKAATQKPPPVQAPPAPAVSPPQHAPVAVQPTQAATASLVAYGAQISPSTFVITKTPIMVGRGSENDMVISHPSVSGRHAELRWETDKYVVEDKKSTNGTFVSYQGQPEQLRRIPSKNAIKDGSLIRFGDVSYLLQITQ
jgi:VWFA-related protein